VEVDLLNVSRYLHILESVFYTVWDLIRLYLHPPGIPFLDRNRKESQRSHGSFVLLCNGRSGIPLIVAAERDRNLSMEVITSKWNGHL